VCGILIATLGHACENAQRLFAYFSFKQCRERNQRLLNGFQKKEEKAFLAWFQSEAAKSSGVSSLSLLRETCGKKSFRSGGS